MPAGKKLLQKLVLMLGVAAASLLTLALLIEGGLRLAAWISLSSQASAQATEGKRTILAVGDSWTFGNERGDANKFSYPAQLQQLLEQEHGKGRFRVVNRGVPGNDSSRLRRDFPSLLNQYRPAGIIIQIGGLNWLGTERMGRRAVPEWLVHLAQRGGWGWVSELRVVRLVGMLTASEKKQGGTRSVEKLKVIRKGLLDILNSSEAVADRRDFPVLPTKGCHAQGEAPPARFRDLLARYSGRTPEEVAKDPTFKLDPDAVQRLMVRNPDCVGGKVFQAEACLKRGDLVCALSLATQARSLMPENLRTGLALLNVHRAQPAEASWNQEAMHLLDALWRRYPKSLPVLHKVLELEAMAKCNLCAMNSTLDTLLKRYPGTPWMTRLKQYILGHIRSDAVWELRDRELREDLTALVAMAREKGAEVLLLNYADLEYKGDPCSREIGKFYHDFSSSFSVGLVDIKGLLAPGGTDVNDVPSDYAKGGHPNAKGYGKIALKVMRAMSAQGWLD